MFKIYIVSIFLLININWQGEANKALDNKFKLGNQILLEKSNELTGKKIALLTNQTGILPDGSHILDAMIANGLNVVKIFTPEHGIRGDENYSETDKTGIPVISLYNGKVKPSNSDLEDVDMIVYDIQDVGARFYTYTSTLYYTIQAAAENKVPVWICDRPMVTNAEYTDGFLLDPQLESFVGKIPTPPAYGMTCGELALFLNSEVFGNTAKLEILKMTGYTRNTDYASLGLTWVKPSPSMFYPSTAVCYLGTCLLEGTNVSEGRGTDKPFEYFGAPWVNSQIISAELNAYNFDGVTFVPVKFTPSEKISAYPPKFFNQECNGIFINVKDISKFNPFKCGAAIISALYNNCPQFKFNKDNFIDKLAGSVILRKMIIAGNTIDEIEQTWLEGLNLFREKRAKYLLYK
ncbi:MAG: DUF1343 domain-containing protein [Ignavibacteria bacterium]|nr:DUF1343 domain-containing protein [Ignavibacteria bacterium]